jgi:hypothetical protein
MDALELLRLNLLSPVVLAFVLGVVATLARSDLKIHEALYSALSIYLLLAIGLKGGAELSATPVGEVTGPVLATLGLGLSIPLWSYVICRRIGRMGVPDAAAMAAHYGSVSAVTFIAADSFAAAAGVPAEGFMPALVAVLEVPSIAVALLIARRFTPVGPDVARAGLGEALREILFGKSILLLVGGALIGLAGGKAGLEKVGPFFVDPFQGVLALFLLEMGMAAARRFRDLRKVGLFLLGFALVLPVLHGALGVWFGTLTGLGVGGATVLGAMAASASYIAAPAAVRVSLPMANPAYYLTGSLVITFPFNLVFGIPLYNALAEALAGGGA